MMGHEEIGELLPDDPCKAETLVSATVPVPTRSRWAKVLTSAEQQLLMDCEATVQKGLQEFLAVGKALMTIKTQRLYRTCYQTFEGYCEKRFGIKGSTAYQKIQAASAYQNVSAIADILEVNEYQMRQIAVLKDPEQQQEVWRQVKELQHATGQKLTGNEIREIVGKIAQAGRAHPVIDRMLPDRIFPGIPLRWELVTMKDEELPSDEAAVLMPLPPLPDTAVTVANPLLRRERPLVMVNPDNDLADVTISESELSMIWQLIGVTPTHQFLLWSRDLSWLLNLPILPPNAELLVRVSSQSELDQAMAAVGDQRIRGLWLVPQTEVQLPAEMPYKRILLGAFNWSPDCRNHGEMTMLRKMVAQLFQGTSVIHINTQVVSCFSQPVKTEKRVVALRLKQA